MKTVSLGSTGEKVSALCLGTMYYGSSVKQELSYRLLDQYLDCGGNVSRHGEHLCLVDRWVCRR